MRPIDDLRSAVIVLVVAHHAALAYIPHAHLDPEHYLKSTAPVVDAQRWWALDLLVSWNDHFFMALLFLLSGLFVLPALRRKGIRRFLLERAQRLGLPFLVTAGLLSPLAFYPAWLLSRQTLGVPFWQRYYGIDGWSPGPAWFLIGVALGAGNLEEALSMTLLRPWRQWAVVGALAYLLTVMLQAQPGGLATQPPSSLQLALALSSATSGTFTILAALGFSRRYLGVPSRGAESLRQNSYGIFLMHYPLVTWSQFALLGVALPAALKFLVSFSVALGGSWLLTILLRHTPVRRVI